jgi:hypothetical protein
MSKRFLSGINVTGSAALNTVADAGSNTDKFLVLDSSNVVSYRTAAELYADLGIGSLPAGFTSTLKHEVKASQAISKGQAVYVSSADGTNMIVSKASNVSEGTSSKTMGLLEVSLSTNGKGNVVTEGLLSGLNTNGATAGDPVWLGVDGALIYGLANKPYAPAHLVFIGIVTRVNSNNGEIFVKVQNGFEMNELHNYQEGSVQNNQVIVYESSTSLYKPKSISTILGFTPSDDSLVVKLAGAQVITGAKSFDAAITVNAGIGFLNGVMPNITSNLYSGIGGNSQGISIVTRPVSTNYTNNLYFATSNNSFTFPNATGTIALTSDLTAYVPSSRTLTINGTTYDLSANRAWTITTDASARSILRYVATANQTTFTISGGYTPGLTDVYRNGVKLDNSTDFTATNGTTIVLTNGASVNDVIEVYRYQTAFLANNALRVVTEFTATAGQTTFNVTYNSGLVDVFYNGSKLLSTEYAAGNGTTIVLNFPCNLNDTLEVHAYSYQVGAFSGQAQLNGTGFVKVSGTTVTYDNSTYLTTSSASSTYLPLSGGTLTGALSGTSATLSGSVGIGVSPSFPLDLLTNSAGTFNTIAQIYNSDFTSGNRSYLRVRQQVNAGGSVSSYFGAGQDSNLYIIANNSARGGDLIISGATGAATFVSSVGIAGAPSGTYGTLSVFGGISTKDDNNGKLEIGRYSSGAPNSYIKIGTNSNSLRITNAADSVDLFTFTNSGNIGILTTAPQTPLQILKDTNTNGTNIEEANMAFSVLSASGQSKIAIGACNAGNYGYIQVMQDATSWTSRNLTLQPRGGNVGIGTYTPATAGGGYTGLDIRGSGGGSIILGSTSSIHTYIYAEFSGLYIQTTSSTPVLFIPGGNEQMRITSAGRVGIQNTAPQGKLEVGRTANSTTSGGHFFSTFSVPVNTWTTVFYAPNNNWAAITEFTWTSSGDYNRSGAAYMRWAYVSATNTLGVVYTLFNNDQNAAAQFRNNGGEIQVYITGGAAAYHVQVRIQGSQAAG